MEEKAGQNCVLDPEAKEFEIAYKGTGSSSGLCNNGTYQSATESFLSILKKDAETGNRWKEWYSGCMRRRTSKMLPGK